MNPETLTAPVDATDPFQGKDTTFEEFSKWRETGEVPERFKAPMEGEAKPEAPAPNGETEPAKEAGTEQEEGTERDDKGKFKEKEPLFNADQQKAFDKAFAKREAKLRREFEARYGQTSVPQATAAESKPETATAPERPEPPKLSTYRGTVEEYEKELGEYPAKLQAFLDAQRSNQERYSSVEKKLSQSEAKTIKTHPDYKDEFQALADDIKNNEEPKLPPHVLKAIAEEADDPHELTYYLAKNRDEFRRLAALGPNEAIREVLRLDVRLGIAKDDPAPVKDAPRPKPKPPDPVGARATATAFDVNDEKIDADEWAAKRNKQLADRRAGR